MFVLCFIIINMIQNFFPSNMLDKGEFVFARFDSVGDSVSYPIVQMPLITQANWQNRVITSIIAIGGPDDQSVYAPVIAQATNLFRGYTIIDNQFLNEYSITLKTDKNTTIVDNWPLTLIANIGTGPGPNPVLRQKKTLLNVSLDNSYITRLANATAVSETIVIPFYIQYK